MNIQLLDWKVNELSYNLHSKKSEEGNSFNLSTGHSFSEEKDNEFYIGFKIEVNDESFDLIMESSFRFEVSDGITEDFKLSDFPKINAPAIAFPFLRAFISNFTLQSGVDPVILPSINFVRLAEQSGQDQLSISP
ncbi:MAG: protein-export chaperone SecB [Cyclobacteriaceae bacterium]